MVFHRSWEDIIILGNFNVLTMDDCGHGFVAHPEGMLLFYFLEGDVLPDGRVNLGRFREVEYDEVGF